jgi:hypothetical protein
VSAILGPIPRIRRVLNGAISTVRAPILGPFSPRRLAALDPEPHSPRRRRPPPSAGLHFYLLHSPQHPLRPYPSIIRSSRRRGSPSRILRSSPHSNPSALAGGALPPRPAASGLRDEDARRGADAGR